MVNVFQVLTLGQLNWSVLHSHMTMTTWKPSKDANLLNKEAPRERLDLGTHRTERITKTFCTAFALHYLQDLRKFSLKVIMLTLLKILWSRGAQMPARSWLKIVKKSTATNSPWSVVQSKLGAEMANDNQGRSRKVWALLRFLGERNRVSIWISWVQTEWDSNYCDLAFKGSVTRKQTEIFKS